MRAETFFTNDEKERIRQAIVAAESKTAGEIVPMIVASAARYTEVELLGIIAGLFVGMIAEAIWSDPWGSPFLNLWPVVGAMLGFLLCRIPAAKRLLTSKNRVAQAVHTTCLAAFTEHGLHYTRDHTGILILVSLLERRVQVLADRGINQKVSPGTWDEVVKILTAGLKSGQACDAFCKAIERCGEILAEHFPHQADDKDELPNRLVTKQLTTPLTRRSEGMKTILNEMGRSRPEVLKYDAATMVDPSIVKAIDDEGFLKKLK